MKINVRKETGKPVIDLALDTIKIGKQALVFLGTKPSAEKTAEDISKKILLKDEKEIDELAGISNSILNALSFPTSQCERLALSIKKGIAFHHAGLVAGQREIIENNFRKGTIKIICCTPTLAAGVDLPAFRTIIKNLKRFGRTSYGAAYDWIPVLEYMQMCGRAGRPKFEKEGQAIAIASSEEELEELEERFVNGKPEEIYSRLSAEPILRTYVLSIISSGIADSREEILAFFEKTLWAYQYKDDPEKMLSSINRAIEDLKEWEMVADSGTDDFASASEISESRIGPTRLGRRVSELYLDPLTANDFVRGLKQIEQASFNVASVLHLLCCASEMILLNAGARDKIEIDEFLTEHGDFLIFDEYYYDYYLGHRFYETLKTTLVLMHWIEEFSEKKLHQKFGVRPGMVRSAVSRAEWLIYSMAEISRTLNLREHGPDLIKLGLRIQNGVKEEILPLLKLRGIGRVRARKLHKNNLKNAFDVKKASLSDLIQILGEKLALSIKEQVGEKVEVSPKSPRKGQKSVAGY